MLGSIDGYKCAVKGYENVKSVTQKEVQMVEEDFLNQIGQNNVASKRSDPVMIVDDFLNQVSDSKPSANKAVSDVSLELLNQLYKINSENPSNETVSIIDDDNFLNEVSDNKAAATDYKSGYDKPVAQKEVKIVEEDFLNQFGDRNVASKNTVSLLDGEDFLNQISESKPSVKAAPIIDDDFLHHVSENKSSNISVAVMIDDNFLNEVTENKSSTKAAVPVIGDDFLDTLPDMQPSANKNVQLVGDDFLDSFDAKPPVPVVEEDFLEQIGGSNGITLAKDSSKREWLISDLKKEFSDCSEAEFYRQLCNFLNDRPDLVMLQSP
uniref:Uncharacterized protein n=1 Tax=Panagrolaimus davidi TaxID=227884 RepID=A0A914QWJ4_9BILA